MNNHEFINKREHFSKINFKIESKIKLGRTSFNAFYFNMTIDSL